MWRGKAAEAGLDLTFLRTIPGSIGGAVRMNAGCYGSYVADHLVEVRVVTRSGEVVTIPAADLHLRYRQSDLPEGAVIVQATFRAGPGDPAALEARMAEQIAKRDASQPTKERSAGSTFRNPAGFSSTGRADDRHELKAWKVIDEAGMRGARRGGAQMSEMHSNFLINAGGATAADLEELGEAVRKRVFDHSGLTLEWEIMRVGEPARTDPITTGRKGPIRGGGGHVEQGSPQSGGTDGWAFRGAGGFACHRARMRGGTAGGRIREGGGGRLRPRPCRASGRAET